MRRTGMANSIMDGSPSSFCRKVFEGESALKPIILPPGKVQSVKVTLRIFRRFSEFIIQTTKCNLLCRVEIGEIHTAKHKQTTVEIKLFEINSIS